MTGRGLPAYHSAGPFRPLATLGAAELRLQHYRLRRCYSEVCPEGEPGNVHVSTVVCKVSPELFERLKKEN